MIGGGGGGGGGGGDVGFGYTWIYGVIYNYYDMYTKDPMHAGSNPSLLLYKVILYPWSWIKPVVWTSLFVHSYTNFGDWNSILFK